MARTLVRSDCGSRHGPVRLRLRLLPVPDAGGNPPAPRRGRPCLTGCGPWPTVSPSVVGRVARPGGRGLARPGRGAPSAVPSLPEKGRAGSEQKPPSGDNPASVRPLVCLNLSPRRRVTGGRSLCRRRGLCAQVSAPPPRSGPVEAGAGSPDASRPVPRALPPEKLPGSMEAAKSGVDGGAGGRGNSCGKRLKGKKGRGRFSPAAKGGDRGAGPAAQLLHGCSTIGEGRAPISPFAAG